MVHNMNVVYRLLFIYIKKKTFVKILYNFQISVLQLNLWLVLLPLAAYSIPTPPVCSNSDGKAAIASNGRECSAIGGNILKKGGNAIDAAIAVLFCEGVTGPQSMGVGGGFIATIYIKKIDKFISLNAREIAPEKATKDMYNNLNEIKGGIATAIPTEIKGYWELYKAFGSGQVCWEDLIQPTIDLCEQGYKVDKFLARILSHDKYKQRILSTPSLSQIFVNDVTGNVYKEGEIAYRPQLARTFRRLAFKGGDEFYKGELAKDFIKDVKAMGGILTENDLASYEVSWRSPVSLELTPHYKLMSAPLPGSGQVLTYILKLVKDRVNPSIDEATIIHRIAEAFKHGYGQRTRLADDRFSPDVNETLKYISNEENIQNIIASISDAQTKNDASAYGAEYELLNDHGTSNVAVLDQEGNAITATSTINNVFGAFVRSTSTGIILNDEMDDFSVPNRPNQYGFQPSPRNFIEPGKQPMSSMSPTVIVDKCGNVRMLIGAAGGSLITTSVALTIIRHLLLQKPFEDVLPMKRFHHQVTPMELQFEEGFPLENIEKKMNEKQHKVGKIEAIQGFSAVTGIAIENNEPHPMFDPRRGGSTAVLDIKKTIVESNLVIERSQIKG